VGDGVRLRWSRIVRAVALAALVAGGRAQGAEPEPSARLPRYHIDLTIDTAKHKAWLKERVTWTNTTKSVVNHVAFNFYPHYRVPEGDYIHLAKTLEMLRLQPSLGIDRNGRFGVMKEARLLSLAGKKYDSVLPYEFDSDNVTALRFPLPTLVKPGESVTVELVCDYHLPNKQGRLGYWDGVTYLTNSLPLLAFCDDGGWQPKPFVPWHQPWFNEAGVFTASITLPENEVLVTPAATKSEASLGDGRKRVETCPFVGRDFAILCSPRFKEFTTDTKLPDGKTVKLRCLAFPEHEFYATEILKIVAEAIPVYSQWFGNYPYDRFTVVESFFGWNGNECAGLVMIDERVFNMPHLARGYVEYLVSHETCHQWWYNLVGTNGYAEPFMDEGAAVHFTHRLLDLKQGKNNTFLDWPRGLRWLPNINRDNYRNGGTYYAIRNGEMHPAAQDLPQYKQLFGLFTGAYDRGSKAFGMIEAELGETAFLDFTRSLVEKYRWRVLQAKDYRAELEAYTGRDHGEFFDRWVYGKGLTDWKVEEVKTISGPRTVFTPSVNTRYTTTLLVRQKGEFTEPTVIELESGGPSYGEAKVRVPVGYPEPIELDEPRASIVPIGDGVWRVNIELPYTAGQVIIDPDRVLLDANPADNVWQSTPRTRVTPLYTMLDETDVTSDYDRLNFTAGPWLWGPSYNDPWYTRSTMLGLRAGVNRPQHYKAGLYTAIRSDYRDAVMGADLTVLGDHFEGGANYEYRIAGPWGGLDGAGGPQRAVGYLRHVIKPSSSMYLPPLMYQEGFGTWQDNFLPFARNPAGTRWDRLAMGGYHYRFNLYTPYWDPECGIWVDLMAAGGVAEFTGWRGMGQGRVELAVVRHPPDWMGWLSNVRYALRGVAMGAWPDYGQFYALGGGTLFRGYDLAERQGSALWVGNAELRWPLARDVNWDILDHCIGARNVWLATFYDVGGIYASGRIIDDVAHALGVGLRVDVAIFSFIERATLRFDAGKTINDNRPWQFWFGIQHAF
jgi:hypothetical protein